MAITSENARVLASLANKKRRVMPSLRAAVNAMCKQCIHDPIGGGGTWRQQVEACTARDCALWAVRPVSKPRG